jgi:hypothetical protein
MPTPAPSFTITTYNDQAAIETGAMAINDRGEVVGTHDGSSREHGL